MRFLQTRLKELIFSCIYVDVVDANKESVTSWTAGSMLAYVCQSKAAHEPMSLKANNLAIERLFSTRALCPYL